MFPPAPGYYYNRLVASRPKYYDDFCFDEDSKNIRIGLSKRFWLRSTSVVPQVYCSLDKIILTEVALPVRMNFLLDVHV